MHAPFIIVTLSKDWRAQDDQGGPCQRTHLQHGLQEAEQGFVSWNGAFGLDPVACALDDHLAAKIRHELIHCRQQAATGVGKHDVLFACDEERGLLDLGVASCGVISILRLPPKISTTT
jgi:hypothetical protein